MRKSVEVSKLSIAGMKIDGVDKLVPKGGKIRLAIPRGGNFLGNEIQSCNDGKPVVNIVI